VVNRNPINLCYVAQLCNYSLSDQSAVFAAFRTTLRAALFFAYFPNQSANSPAFQTAYQTTFLRTDQPHIATDHPTIAAAVLKTLQSTVCSAFATTVDEALSSAHS